MSTDVDKVKHLLQRLKQRIWNKPRASNEQGAVENSEDIKNVVLRMMGVIAVESCEAREQGHYVVATLTINVNPKITVQEGYEIGQRVRWLLMHRFTHLTDVVIHVKPFAPEYPYKSNETGSQEEFSTILQ
ncbi:cation transporter dimerization domain-containing protein [Paenibacillus septentrionalis]|uniref:Cation transporter dimerization domain-containing protein n=1 Tax=Paenibacillus septentrionalis TaxID=429342 RepID=A0ABW1V142_9BACL